MGIIWEYVKKRDSICILKVYGDTSALEIPAHIEGCPVTEVGPYAFSASAIPKRFQVPDREKRRLEVKNGFLEQTEPVEGDRLESVALPDTVETLGDYAFYGCRKLSQISFTDSLKRIGSGAFVGCSAVRKFIFVQNGKGRNSLSQMLSELRYAITVEILTGKQKACLVFPEYYEMSVENVPARIFEVHFHGTGYRYRQCFRDGVPDYKGYDELFGLALCQEPPQVLTALALNRLQYPVELGAAARKAYLDYFSTCAKTAGAVLLGDDNLEAVRFIAEAGGFDGQTGIPGGLWQAAQAAAGKPAANGAGDFYMASLGETGYGVDQEAAKRQEEERGRGREEGPREALDVMLDLAGELGRTECLGFLMDYRHRKQGIRKKTFDL